MYLTLPLWVKWCYFLLWEVNGALISFVAQCRVTQRQANAGELNLEALRFWLLVFVNVPPFPFSSWTNTHWGTIDGPLKGDTVI